MILVIAHDTRVSSGSLGKALARRGFASRTLRLHLGDPVPDDARRFKAIVSLGGTMSARDERHHPFLRDELPLLRSAVVAGVPVLGICLGAQQLARALGGAVRRAPVEERGWSDVRLTATGTRDALFAGVGSPLRVFQWHEDSFTLPPGAEALATGDACRNQAFRFAMAWGVQFHPEIDAAAIEDWTVGTEHYVEQRRLTPELLPAWRRRAGVLFGNFLRMSACVGRVS
jgi:GMP synthase-like glutamine amidotransferase